MTQPPSGILLVLSGPSGAGKTTLARRLLERHSEKDETLVRSVSITTRQPRPSEQDRGDYVFLSEGEFAKWLAHGKLLEHTTSYGHHYGTPRHFVTQALNKGKHILLVLDVQGFRQLAARHRGHLVGVFVLPPSLGTLAKRLRGRCDDNEGSNDQRLAAAQNEIAACEEYDYTLVNSNLDATLEQLDTILQIERSRRHRPPSRSLPVRRTVQTT